MVPRNAEKPKAAVGPRDNKQQGGRSFRERKKDKTEGARGREARNSKPAWEQQREKAEASYNRALQGAE